MSEGEENTESGKEPEKSPEKGKEKKPLPQWFKKGQSGNPGGVFRSNARGKIKATRLLMDMRHVYKNSESKDESQGQKKCRKWFKDDPKGFLTQLARLEENHRTRSARRLEASAKAAGTLERDENEDKVLEQVERLLEEWDADKRK